MTPALDAAMASWLGNPIRAAADENSITDPPLFFITRCAARTVANAEVRLKSRSHAIHDAIDSAKLRQKRRQAVIDRIK
jgi:hypothetical protein